MEGCHYRAKSFEWPGKLFHSSLFVTTFQTREWNSTNFLIAFFQEDIFQHCSDEDEPNNIWQSNFGAMPVPPMTFLPNSFVWHSCRVSIRLSAEVAPVQCLVKWYTDATNWHFWVRLTRPSLGTSLYDSWHSWRHQETGWPFIRAR